MQEALIATSGAMYAINNCMIGDEETDSDTQTREGIICSHCAASYRSYGEYNGDFHLL